MTRTIVYVSDLGVKKFEDRFWIFRPLLDDWWCRCSGKEGGTLISTSS